MKDNLQNVLSRVNGDVAEVGVYQGATAEILARYCNRFKRKLFLFDTFDGFKVQDLAGIDADKENGKFSDTTLEMVRRRVGDGDFISWKIGWFPNSIDEECRNTRYAFVHIDCDLYNPISEALAFFGSI